jgi:hypothetical protein
VSAAELALAVRRSPCERSYLRYAHARSSRLSAIVRTIDAMILNRQPDVLN